MTIGTTLLVDIVAEVERNLDAADLALVRLDRLTLLGYSDEHMHRGYVVPTPRTRNTNQMRDQSHARVLDSVEIQHAYRIRALEQRASRDEALVLEEQIRKAMTSRFMAWGDHLHFEGVERVYQGEDGQWLIITQTYTTRRMAVLGG